MPETRDAEALTDPRIRGLIEQYAALAGAHMDWEAADLAVLHLPRSELAFFGGEGRLPVSDVRLAFSLHALEHDPDAEMATVGSGFLERLTDAVRERGWRHRHPMLVPEHVETEAPPELNIPFRNAEVVAGASSATCHLLGRVLARVVIRSGAEVTEQLVHSDLFDLVSAAPAPAGLAERCATGGRNDAVADGHVVASLAGAEKWLTRMLDGIHARLKGALESHETAAASALRSELMRLRKYYDQLAEEGAGDQKRAAALEREYEKRKSEEERRHQVRAALHPIQLEEWPVLVQRAEWSLRSASGKTAIFVAQRYLSGDTGWAAFCPSCATAPSWLTVCSGSHAACSACASFCSICEHGFCADHGITGCRVDGAPACTEHARTCRSCDQAYCTAHEAACTARDHVACTTCISSCGVCQRSVCARHATRTPEDAPSGSRILCPECVVFCEGGSNEPVGRDEVEGCASCERSVCRSHQALCAVDGLVHCSRHLGRSDHSRRLVCEQHRGTCHLESEALFASDEVVACSDCGGSVCSRHSDTCAVHGTIFCTSHLKPLLDTQGQMGCEIHRSTCHVDGGSFSLSGTSPCPVCDRATCRSHHVRCRNCGRRVCTADAESEGRCVTCATMHPETEPDDEIVAASVRAGGGPVKVRSWRIGRDASHRVVAAELGWGRRLVFAVPHGTSDTATVVRHGLLGRRQHK